MMDILQVRDLKVVFPSEQGAVNAVDGISFNIGNNEVFGLVGESGSGKTLSALSILRLISRPGRIVSGGVIFGGVDLLRQDEEYLRSIRGSRISMVFQEPASALNPVFTVGYQIAEAVLAHRKVGASKAMDEAILLLSKVHIANPEKVYRDYPHQLSGGIRQRAMIAMALVNSPELLILDEPTTALDVTIQAQILDLLDEIVGGGKMSALFISHDFGIIRRMCSRVAVMRKGRIIETGETGAVLQNPRDQYTASLLASVRALS